MEIGLAQEAWKLANDHSGLPAMVLTPDIAKIVSSFASIFTKLISSKLRRLRPEVLRFAVRSRRRLPRWLRRCTVF